MRNVKFKDDVLDLKCVQFCIIYVSNVCHSNGRLVRKFGNNKPVVCNIQPVIQFDLINDKFITIYTYIAK